MRQTRMLGLWAAAVAGALTPAPAAGAEQAWILATTPNFELYTTESQAKAREAVLHFENVRAFFVRSSKALKLPAYPVRIVAFRSEKEYRPYRPGENASAYYRGGVHHDTIVMQALGNSSYEVATHEYVHLLLRDASDKLPMWLQEGLAEYYSTLRQTGKNSVRVGGFPEGRIATLQAYVWMDTETLIRADHAWLARASQEQAGVFYAQSWAMVHLLALSDEYRPKYQQFLAEVFSGAATIDALRKVYGKSVGEIRAELRNYFSASLFKAYFFPFGLEAETTPPDIRPATAVEWRVALADLDAAIPEKREQARQAYARLAAENPESWELRMGMAYLELSARDLAAASQQFAAAEKLGCRDPRAFLHWGMYAPAEGGPRERARVFLKAAELKPGDPAIAYNAGLGLAAAGDCDAALPHLLKLPSITPAQAPFYLRAVAVCAHNTGQDDRAQVSAKQLRSLARTPQEEQLADALVRMVNEPRQQPSPNPR
jgi:Flp pilus assembly protein TadD